MTQEIAKRRPWYQRRSSRLVKCPQTATSLETRRRFETARWRDPVEAVAKVAPRRDITHAKANSNQIDLAPPWLRRISPIFPRLRSLSTWPPMYICSCWGC